MLLEDTSCCVQGSKFTHRKMGLNKWKKKSYGVLVG